MSKEKYILWPAKNQIYSIHAKLDRIEYAIAGNASDDEKDFPATNNLTPSSWKVRRGFMTRKYS